MRTDGRNNNELRDQSLQGISELLRTQEMFII